MRKKNISVLTGVGYVTNDKENTIVKIELKGFAL